jgi:hypothetical protein
LAAMLNNPLDMRLWNLVRRWVISLTTHSDTYFSVLSASEERITTTRLYIDITIFEALLRKY